MIRLSKEVVHRDKKFLLTAYRDGTNNINEAVEGANQSG